MLELMDIAKAAGCDAVKHQWVSSAVRLCHRRKAPEYLGAYRLIEGDVELLQWLVDETHARGMKAIATCYLPEDAAIIGALADCTKISSFEAGDGLLLRMAAQTGRPVYVSTGMMTQLEVTRIFDHLQPDVLLHCCSSYPSPPEALNLRVLTAWDRVFRHHRIGWSDHSCDVRTGMVAVGAGCEVVEVHYRHPETPPTNADYATALTPAQLAEYVAGIRFAERTLGDGHKAPQAAESDMRKYRALA